MLKNLNNEQKDAVLNTEGPNLIVAGAGSGKTRVLTTKLAYIISQKEGLANPNSLCAFTNKAAKEMQSRVMHYLKVTKCSSVVRHFSSISVKF